MRSVSAAQSQLQNVSLRSHGEIVPASTPITASVATVVHDPGPSLSVAVGSPHRAVVLGVCCTALFMVGLDNTSAVIHDNVFANNSQPVHTGTFRYAALLILGNDASTSYIVNNTFTNNGA